MTDIEVDLKAELTASVEGVLSDIMGARLSMPPQSRPPISLSACIHSLGAFGGVLVVSASASFVRTIATALLETDEVSDGDGVDALTEFANILIGNLKGMYEGSSLLTVPVCSGAAIVLPAGDLLAKCEFADPQNGVLRIELYRNVAADLLPDAA